MTVTPKEYVAESVVAALHRRVKGKRVLLVRAKVARDVIPRELRKAGAEVDVVEAYETIAPKSSQKRLRAVLSSPRKPHAITFTSSSTVRNFVQLLGLRSARAVAQEVRATSWRSHRVHRTRNVGHAARVRPAGGHRGAGIHDSGAGGGDHGEAAGPSKRAAPADLSACEPERVWRPNGKAATLFGKLRGRLKSEIQRFSIPMNLHDAFHYLLLALSAMLLLSTSTSAQNHDSSPSSTMNIPKPPATRQQPVTDDYFGQKVVDPYRWLEDGSTPETQQWVSGQLAYTRSILDKLPGRDKLHDRIEQLLEIGNLGETQVGGDYYFHTRRDGKQNQPVLYVRKGVDGKDEVLIDANRLSKDGTTALDWWRVSHDGKYVAYGTSESGSEMSTLHVIETATHKLLPDVIERTRAASIAWKPDDSGFYYTRYPKKGDVAEGQEMYNRHVFYHALGSDPAKDPLIFGEGRDPQDWPSIVLSNDGQLARHHGRARLVEERSLPQGCADERASRSGSNRQELSLLRPTLQRRPLYLDQRRWSAVSRLQDARDQAGARALARNHSAVGCGADIAWTSSADNFLPATRRMRTRC